MVGNTANREDNGFGSPIVRLIPSPELPVLFDVNKQ
jgi:hypothetical protein